MHNYNTLNWSVDLEVSYSSSPTTTNTNHLRAWLSSNLKKTGQLTGSSATKVQPQPYLLYYHLSFVLFVLPEIHFWNNFGVLRLLLYSPENSCVVVGRECLIRAIWHSTSRGWRQIANLEALWEITQLQDKGDQLNRMTEGVVSKKYPAVVRHAAKREMREPVLAASVRSAIEGIPCLMKMKWS